MRRLFTGFLALTLICASGYAMSGNLYEYAASKHRAVNIKLDECMVAEGCDAIKSEDLAGAFKKRLLERRTIKFNVVEASEEADLAVSLNVKNFVYSEKDPVDIVQPIGLLVDLAAVQNYARLEFEVSVSDPAKNKLLWKKSLKATLTKSDMPYEKSIPLITDRAAYVFIKECFGRPK